MVIFLTSLRNPLNSNDYETVIRLFKVTAQSICSQTDNNFKLVVTCNQKPEIGFHHENIIYNVVDFPPPSEIRSSQTGLDAVKKDKGTKLLSGLLYSLKFNPTHFMIVDADDWINIDTAREINCRNHIDVFYANSGNIVNRDMLTYKTRYGMNRYCGSTFAYKIKTIEQNFPFMHLKNDFKNQKALLEKSEPTFLYEIIGDHPLSYKICKKLGITPKPFKTVTTCWIISTGENHSGTEGGFNGLPFNSDMCERFGLDKQLENPSKSTLKLTIRNLLTSLKSRATWEYSKLAGKNIF